MAYSYALTPLRSLDNTVHTDPRKTRPPPAPDRGPGPARIGPVTPAHPDLHTPSDQHEPRPPTSTGKQPAEARHRTPGARSTPRPAPLTAPDDRHTRSHCESGPRIQKPRRKSRGTHTEITELPLDITDDDGTHGMTTTLFPHQREAVQNVTREFASPPADMAALRAGDGPWAGLRTQVVAATGTGKTRIAAACAAHLAPHGRVLVLVPTLDLLTQTVAAWRAAGRTGPMIAVCSLRGDPALDAAGVRCTTSAPQYALWSGRTRHLTVFGTYASLRVLLRAQKGPYGLEPPAAMDLVVVDEAHRTSGALGKSWAAVHDNRRLPAARRLYMTATPRIWEPPPGSAYAALAEDPPVPELDPMDPDPELDEWDGWQDDDLELADELEEDEHSERTAYQPLPVGYAASMDDERLFGRVSYSLPLSAAVSAGLVAPFRIVVAEVTDPEVQAAAAASGSRLNRLSTRPADVEAYRGARLAALQTGLLKLAWEHDLRRILTFHHRTIEAEAFAVGLPKAFKRLRKGAAASAYPGNIAADWISGEHDPQHRRRVLGRFGAGADADGVAVTRAFVSNCRVLGEGVDVPEIDSIAILDPKGSIVEIVQAVGRCIRPSAAGTKLASIIIPIFLERGETPDDMLVSPSWRPLQRVLQALRAHDASICDVLAVPQVNGEAQGDRIEEPAAEDTDAEDGTLGEGERPEWRPILRYSALRDPAQISQFVELRVVDPQSRNWLRGYVAAERYQRAHGNLVVPIDAVDIDHHGIKFPLGRWISEMRAEYARNHLERGQIQRLESLGMVWSVHDQAWEDGLAIAREYARRHGTLAAPADAVVDGYPIGTWLANRRAQDRRGELAAERAAALDALVDGEPWHPPHWPVAWQRHLTHATDYLREQAERGGGARLDDVGLDVTHRGTSIGRWVARQRSGWDGLNEPQREQLRALGLTPPATADTAEAEAEAAAAVAVAVPDGPRPKRTREQAWAIAVAAAAAYRARVGHLEVPRGHVESVTAFDGWPEDVRLGVWVTTTRSRRAKLSAERIAELDALGMRWT
ncbi:Helicase associated domain protein [Embleya sp. NPDC020630]|uniref:DEAD/DEAH box helicase n=1 Tax=Embleya sp. NPDC020630 TaxID=3363979 RepID=UPI0037A39E71